MHAYGVKTRDRGCCPGHDKYPQERYNNKAQNTAKRRHAQKHRKTRARMAAQRMIHMWLQQKEIGS